MVIYIMYLLGFRCVKCTKDVKRCENRGLANNSNLWKTVIYHVTIIIVIIINNIMIKLLKSVYMLITTIIRVKLEHCKVIFLPEAN